MLSYTHRPIYKEIDLLMEYHKTNGFEAYLARV